MADALVRLGETLRRCLGVLIRQTDLLACSSGLLVVGLPTIILGHLTFSSTLKRTPSTSEAACVCSVRDLTGRRPIPSTIGERVLDFSRRRQSLV
jgi:hypothetical protein